MEPTAPTKRFSASKLELLRDAAGGPRAIAAKSSRFVRALRAFAEGAELDLRLGRLRSKGLGPIIEEPRYHRDLLDYTRRFRKDPLTPPLLRSNIDARATWSDLERTFGSLRTSMRYFLRMPATPIAAARHTLRTKALPVDLAEPR
jgi:hypothetical protein